MVAQNFRRIAVGGMVDVVVAIRAEISQSAAASGSERRAANRNTWYAAKDIRKGKAAAEGSLDVRRLRKILGTNHVAEDGAVGVPVSAVDHELGSRSVSCGDIVLVPRRVSGGCGDSVDDCIGE